MSPEKAPYTALYRRWRPQLFSQVVGQEHITRTLKNSLSGSRVAHAYLFCGLRGTGKTTMAKLLAKALNCQEGANNEEPCNQCRSCLEITEGRSLDVIEIDAASNRGIDEIRDLREKIRYAAASSRYKVYIIDEAHMLTNEAFNALLKTLEEPPPGVVFILATTEVHKLPLTVVSRCQRFEFHLLETTVLAAHLAYIAREMNFAIETEACTLLARLAEGSARDALGLLEQCRAYGGEGLDYNEALEILGLTHPELSYRLLSAVAEGNIGGGLAIINEIVSRGRDLYRFLRELILYLRKLLVLQFGKEGEQALDDVPGLKPYLIKQKGVFDHMVILEMLEILQQLTMQMKSAPQPQFLLELTFLRLLRVYRLRHYLSSEDLFLRLEELEDKLRSAGLTLDAAPASKSETPSVFPSKQEPSPPNQKQGSVPPRQQTAPPKQGSDQPRQAPVPPKPDLLPPKRQSAVAFPSDDDIPPWEDNAPPRDVGSVPRSAATTPSAEKKEKPSPPEEKHVQSPGGALSFTNLINRDQKNISPPRSQGAPHSEIPDPPPPERRKSPGPAGPASITDSKKSAHTESDPYLQQALDMFNGRLINP